MTPAEHRAYDAYLRSIRTCMDRYCDQFTVEEALLLCMFEIWREEYGPGWERSVE